ncbi:MAG: polysaccharide deacetylase [Clostridia bacterium]|nr:polysaccharide deacetylase [Clostridia bacterium]
MDLISIRRKYRNIRNIIIASFIMVLVFALIIMICQIFRLVKSEKIYVSYLKQYKKVLIDINVKNEQGVLEEERIRQERLPNLTEQGIANIENIYRSDTKRVFLTFDDGPSQTSTIPILDILKQENVKATFFLLGSRVELYPDIAKRAYDEGHYLASHGYSHIYSQIYASPQCVIDEYNKTLTSIRNAIGQPDYNPHLFRFPGGYTGGKYAEVKRQAATLLQQNAIAYVDWNALTSDAAGKTTTNEFIAELEKTVPKYNSVVVLMHDSAAKKNTVEALPTIIAYFRDRGFDFQNFYSVIK